MNGNLGKIIFMFLIIGTICQCTCVSAGINSEVIWAENEVAVCVAGGNQSNQQIVPDGSGGAFIVWQDHRGSSDDIYAQKIDSSGNRLWTNNGVVICDANGSQTNPQIISDGSGATITWQDTRGSSSDIYAQKLDSSGNKLWANNGVVICNASGNQIYPQIISDGSSGAIITWQDYRGGSYSDIYAQRVDANGNALWANNGVAICNAGKQQEYPIIETDGSNGAIILWQDARYSGSKKIYAQRVVTYRLDAVIGYTIGDGAKVNFQGNATFNPNSDRRLISAYEWDFGDGVKSNEPNPMHRYAGNGVYRVSLKVTDDLGNYDITSVNVEVLTVYELMAVINYTVSADGLTVNFRGDVTFIPDNGIRTIDSYEWNFDDGYTSTQNDPTHTHTYMANGRYNVSLKVTDYLGTIRMAYASISVSASPYEVETVINYESNGGIFNFYGSGFFSPDYGNRYIVSYEWDFGDGTKSYQMNPTHRYTKDGVYNVVLKVTDECGNNSTAIVILNIVLPADQQTIWYLAEGATSGTFSEWVLIMNPNKETADVTVTFMLEDGQTIQHNITVNPTTRYTIHVNDIVPDKSVSTKVESTNGVGIIAERAMYWDVEVPGEVSIYNDTIYTSKSASSPDQDGSIGVIGDSNYVYVSWIEHPIRIGDSWDRDFSAESKSKGFFGFNIGKVKNKIISSTLRVYQYSVYGNPYMDLGGGLLVDHVDFGSSLDWRDFYYGTLSENIGTISSVSDSGWKELDVTRYMQDDKDKGRKYSQFRLHFPMETDNDKKHDSAIFESANGTYTNKKPELVVTSEGPLMEHWKGGHNSSGVTNTSTTWYLAEGCTNGFDEWVLIMNPNTIPADVTVTFMPEDGRTVERHITLNPTSRYTIHVNSIVPDRSVSTKVESTNGVGIIAERAMYWDADGRRWIEGHDSVGVTNTSTTWYLAEGCTNGFDEWVLIMNPNTIPANVIVTFMPEDGRTVERHITLNPTSRYTIHVNSIVPDRSVSTKVESTNGVGVIAERAMYWDVDGVHWAGGHCSGGVTEPSLRWYLAEGATSGTFSEWVLIMNPNKEPANVNVTFMLPSGETIERNIIVNSTSRYTINVNNIVPDRSVSTKLESTNGVSIIAERAMYWDSGGKHWAGGHCSVGVK